MIRTVSRTNMGWLIPLGMVAAWVLGPEPAQAQGRRNFDPGEMISRLDTNGNGQIEPDEIQGRGFLERALRDSGHDPSQSISVEQAQEIMRERMERFRSQRGGDWRGRGDGEGREGDPPDREQRDGERPGDSSANPTGSAPPVPLAPGFNATEVTDTVPGFGPADPYVALEKKYGSRVVEQVKNSLRRYDRNGNSYIDSDEMTGGRWSSDPKASDTDKDNRLSLDELAQRYKQREGTRGGSPARGPASSSSASSTSGSSSSPNLDSRLASFAEAELKQYDTNRDGVLQKEEWTKMPKDMKRWDKNNDGQLTKDELVDRLASYSRGGSSGWSNSNRTRKSGSEEQPTYRFLTATERLPEGLPSWFAAKDANADGQVRMSEYATAWSDAKVAEFAKYDLNGDGVITPKECLAVEAARKK